MVNCAFDLSLLHAEIKRLEIDPRGLQLAFPIFDTLVVDQTIVDPYRVGRRTLTATCSAYGVVIRGAHQADGDCIAAIALTRAIAAKYAWIRNTSIWDLQRKQQISAMQRARAFTEYRRSDNTEPDFQANEEWPYIGVREDS